MKEVLLEDILSYKFLSAIKYSPDEKAAAFVVSHAVEEDNKYEGVIYIYENEQVRQLTGLGKETSFFWEDNENLLFAACRTDKEKNEAKEGLDDVTHFYRINIHGGEAVKAYDIPFSVQGIKRLNDHTLIFGGSIDVRYPDYYKMDKEEREKIGKEKKEDTDYEVFDETPFWFNGAGVVNGFRSALFLYDEKTKDLKRITGDKFEVSDFAIHSGKIYMIGASFTCKRPNRPQLFVYEPDTDKMTCLYDTEDYRMDSIFFMEDRMFVAACHEKEHGLNQLDHVLEFDPVKGGLVDWLKPDRGLFGGSVGSDVRLAGGEVNINVNDKVYYISTDRNLAGLYSLSADKKIETIFAEEGSVDCFDIKKDGSEILAIALLDMKLQELYLIKDGKAKQLTHFSDEYLKDRYVAKPEKMTIMSQGVDIDGWVLKPMNYEPGKKYPAIFDIHGGPMTVYGEVFYHEMQAWASMGYFVFFCNPTGSDGRGDEFADIRGKYGTIDYENLMDFCDAVLKAYPDIDEKRVGETGGSYGGFMTNWIVGHTDRFAACATQRSISNWISFYGVSDIGPDFAMDQTLGDIGDKLDKLWWHSPLKYVDNVTTPLLFIHSDEDYRCPLEQGIQFYTALAQRGQIVRMCMFHGENHELSRSGKPKHRMRRLNEITDWMNKYLKLEKN